MSDDKYSKSRHGDKDRSSRDYYDNKYKNSENSRLDYDSYRGSSSHRMDRDFDSDKRYRSSDDSYSSDYDRKSRKKSKKKSKKKDKKKSKKKSKNKDKDDQEDSEEYDSDYQGKNAEITQLDEATFDKDSKNIPSKPNSPLKRESWMTLDDLGLDAFNVDESNSSASKLSRSIVFETNTEKTDPIPVFKRDKITEKARDYIQDNISSVSLDCKNKLQARILKAQMLGSSDLAQLEKEYAELESFPVVQQEENNVVVLPSFNIRGDYLDTGSHEKRIFNKKDKAMTHDDKGNRINFSGDQGDDDIATLLRKEKQSQNEDLASSLARNILRDQRYSNDNDYLEEKSEQLAAQTRRSDYQKRLIAVNDYKKTQKALDRCWFCSRNGEAPVVPVVSMGHHAYLALPTRTELVPGQCLIVPGEHLLTSLDGDDPTWLEIRNFMKCLMQAFAEQDKGVIFIETVSDLSRCNHTVIECIPMPWDSADDAPAYFREGLLEAADEWSTHKKIIDTKSRTFRRSMTSRLPYFHVWFHPDGGYGHVIEDSSRFPSSFASEIIAGMLELDPIKWRRPTNYHFSLSASRIEEFKATTNWPKFDWTSMLD